MKCISKVYLVILLVMAVFATSCSTTRSTLADKSSKGLSSADIYKHKVIGRTTGAECLTAKMHLNLSMGDKDVSLNGNLRMKRNEVIQLSLSFPIIGEVGRIEFAPDYVLIVDRINTRYVRASYGQVDFLNASNLDYRVLESVFWNEVFYPGADVKSKLSEYTVASSGDHTLLSLSTAPKLDYAFLTITESALLDRTTVTSKNLSDNSTLTCVYSDFRKFESGQFPAGIKLSFAGHNQTFGLDISLSSLSSDTGWNTRTQLSSKYQQMDAESLLKNLIP